MSKGKEKGGSRHIADGQGDQGEGKKERSCRAKKGRRGGELPPLYSFFSAPMPRKKKKEENRRAFERRSRGEKEKKGEVLKYISISVALKKKKRKRCRSSILIKRRKGGKQAL